MGQAQAHLGLGQAAEKEGRNAHAIRHAEHALRLYRAESHLAGQACSLNGLAWNHGLLGHPAWSGPPHRTAVQIGSAYTIEDLPLSVAAATQAGSRRCSGLADEEPGSPS